MFKNHLPKILIAILILALLGGGVWWWQRNQVPKNISDQQAEFDYPTVTLSDKWQKDEIEQAVANYRSVADESELDVKDQQIINEIEIKSIEEAKKFTEAAGPGSDAIIFLKDSQGNLIDPRGKKASKNTLINQVNAAEDDPDSAGAVFYNIGEGTTVIINEDLTSTEIARIVAFSVLNPDQTVSKPLAVNNIRLLQIDATYIKNKLGEIIVGPVEIKTGFDDATVSAHLATILYRGTYIIIKTDEKKSLIFPAAAEKFDIDGDFMFEKGVGVVTRQNFKEAYPRIEQIYGSRVAWEYFWDLDFDQNQNKIKVKVITSAEDNAFYSPIVNEIVLSNLNQNESYTAAHELTHAFLGLYSIIINGFVSEGITCALTEYALGYIGDQDIIWNRTMQGLRKHEANNLSYRSLEEFETGLFSPGQGIEYYTSGAALFVKLYLEDPLFFKQFKQNLINQYKPLFNTDQISNVGGLNNRQVIELIKTSFSKTKIEGLTLDDWIISQNILYPAESEKYGLCMFIMGHLRNEFAEISPPYPNLDSILLNRPDDKFYLLNTPINLDRASVSFYGLEKGSFKQFGEIMVSGLNYIYKTKVLLKMSELEGENKNSYWGYQGLIKVVIQPQGEKYLPRTQYLAKLKDNVISNASILGLVLDAPDGSTAELSGPEGVLIQNIPVQNGLFVVDDPAAVVSGQFTVKIKKPNIVCSSSGCSQKEKVIEQKFNKIKMTNYLTVINTEKPKCCYDVTKKTADDWVSAYVNQRNKCQKICGWTVQKEGKIIKKFWGEGSKSDFYDNLRFFFTDSVNTKIFQIITI